MVSKAMVFVKCFPGARHRIKTSDRQTLLISTVTWEFGTMYRIGQ